MDEKLHYLLHEELEGLFDPPAERAAQKPAAPATGTSAVPAAAAPAAVAADVPGGTITPPPAPAAATPPGAVSVDDLLGRLADPRVLQALAHLLGGALMSAAAPTAPPAASTANTLDEQLAALARDWLGIELGDEERAKVRGAVALLEAQQRLKQAGAAPAAGSRRPAGSVIDLDRQRIQGLIDQNLSRTQAVVIGNARAERAAEEAVLGTVEKAQSLDDLRPPKPQPGSAAGSAAGAQAPRTDPLIAQIADQLTGLIKREVDECFQQQFGPLAGQLQAVIDAAQASGLLSKNPESASSDESRGTTENSGKTAANPEQDNSHNTAGKATASASQRN